MFILSLGDNTATLEPAEFVSIWEHSFLSVVRSKHFITLVDNVNTEKVGCTYLALRECKGHDFHHIKDGRQRPYSIIVPSKVVEKYYKMTTIHHVNWYSTGFSVQQFQDKFFVL